MDKTVGEVPPDLSPLAGVQDEVGADGSRHGRLVGNIGVLGTFILLFQHKISNLTSENMLERKIWWMEKMRIWSREMEMVKTGGGLHEYLALNANIW